jgi:hypothetical protein
MEGSQGKTLVEHYFCIALERLLCDRGAYFATLKGYTEKSPCSWAITLLF